MNATKNAKITKDSIRAKDKISGVNSLSPAAGLRAIPSSAAAAAFPCADVPPKTARPIAIPAPIATSPALDVFELAAAVAAASCANAAAEANVVTANNNTFFIKSPFVF